LAPGHATQLPPQRCHLGRHGAEAGGSARAVGGAARLGAAERSGRRLARAQRAADAHLKRTDAGA
jgi:hypothetical protein